MTIPFPDIDPYEVLEVSKSSTPLEIKKSYKKLCLKYHPDKLQQSSLEVSDEDLFPKIQFSYSILSDSNKRQRYDTSGWLGDSSEEGEEGEGFDWKEYFDNTNEKITIEMIEEDKIKYQGSVEEKNDIIQNFIYYEGDFIKLFEVIPHLEFDEIQEDRVYQLIETGIKEGTISLDTDAGKVWSKYCKTRKTKVKQMLKKLSKEAKEAEELEKKIKGGKKIKNEGDLAALIKSRQSGRLDDLIGKLESKYGGKRGKKRSKDIDDDEFERIQREMKKKR
ncbi:hypothetical protein CAAN1_21S00166 [[Candida] anglica]|uniref:J domain-containing protein n=1 Tax=[Candida] anglica TaxID=148631 RepID=A0ABP0EHC3_9ASCO